MCESLQAIFIHLWKRFWRQEGKQNDREELNWNSHQANDCRTDQRVSERRSIKLEMKIVVMQEVAPVMKNEKYFCSVLIIILSAVWVDVMSIVVALAMLSL